MVIAQKKPAKIKLPARQVRRSGTSLRKSWQATYLQDVLQRKSKNELRILETDVQFSKPQRNYSTGCTKLECAGKPVLTPPIGFSQPAFYFLQNG